MPRNPASCLAILALAFAGLHASSQTFQLKAIKFAGAPEYSDQELLATVGLLPGTTLSYAQMNTYAQKLVDIGAFSSVAFKFDGQDLIFQLTPATGLLPLHLQNLPLHAGKDLDDKLHHQFPLYHGLLPEQGGITESIRLALEQMLAAQGIKASVAVSPYKDTPSSKTTAVNFAIVSPQVLIGDLRTEGAIVALDPRASAILAKYPGAPYDSLGTPAAIEADLTTYYKDQGYSDPAIHAGATIKPVLSPDAVRIPLRISIVPGVQYKLGAIQLAPDLVITQADFDRKFHFHPGDAPDGSRLRDAWKFIELQYHDRGYVKAKVQPAATTDSATRTINYTVKVIPGPPYTMGKLAIENVTDDLRTQMIAAWKMPSGSAFNESVISAFFSSHGVNPALEQAFSAADYHYTLQPNDDAHTVDVKLALEKKP
ncbi:MAG TPA: hypothetical protein VHZ28_17265 [Terracidiphilus sp.]|nr:hypothetical protein [Terracidiphilus sp.]